MATEQRTTIAEIWHWLRDVENRKVIAWIGSGVVVLLGAILYQNTGTSPRATGPSETATTQTGISSTDDINIDGNVTINGGPQEDAEPAQQ
ncbi:MAG: hypothetical protein Tsb0032_16760 [Kiloniellaceae bacterium]